MSHPQDIDLLRYTPFSSSIEPSFWHKLMQIKLDVDKLDEKPRTIWGSFSIADPPGLTSFLNVDCSSFNREFELSKNALGAYGVLLNKNTIEGFKNADKMKLMAEQGAEILECIKSGEGLCKPALLNRFLILTFADLKKYRFYYWFTFPALMVSDSYVKILSPIRMLKDVFSPKQLLKLAEVYFNISDWTQRAAFVINVHGDSVNCLHLQDYEQSFFNTSQFEDELAVNGSYLVISDPCYSHENPGWPSRNILVMLAYKFPQLVHQRLKLICLRLSLSQSCEWLSNKSLLVEIELSSVLLNDPAQLQWVGWERNNNGKFGPRLVNLSSSMDPKRLAESSVDLNLKLMKWRLVPDLDLDVVKNTKCLLLGAGTLGCAVARTLLAWGVRNITLVDNGRVSYSNPVRQSLFVHADCHSGGRPKAVAAAEALHNIFPGVNAKGVELSIPMPGHPVGPSLIEETKKSVECIEQLVCDHDALFLLMDSRESRWLPTLLGCSMKKLTICSALGFDTFLVMRHGIRVQGVPSGDVELCFSGDQLGCYYCTDVVAPGNSVADRTLDQQCTVTRPGLSAIAAGFVVELMVSVLQHPLGSLAPADRTAQSSSSASSSLGRVPHSLRGYLSQFELIMPASPKFTNCIACSEKVVQEYELHKFEFLQKVFNCPDYLKEVSGLAQLCRESENVEVLDWSGSESGDTE